MRAMRADDRSDVDRPWFSMPKTVFVNYDKRIAGLPTTGKGMIIVVNNGILLTKKHTMKNWEEDIRDSSISAYAPIGLCFSFDQATSP